MLIKFINWLGLAGCIALVVSCFLPWAYYADIHQHFTGFYSFKNEYGKPGKFMVVFGAVSFALMLLPRLWAKRVNLFLCALTVGYTIKTYILFSSCYNNYCPETEPGIYVMLVASVLMLTASIFPQLPARSGTK